MPEPHLRRTLAPLILIALLVAVPPVLSAVGQEYYVSLASRMLIYALAAASLDLILGYAGLVSLGHAAFFGFGAYVVGILAFHHQNHTALLGVLAWTGTNQALLAWPAAVLASGLLALGIGALSLRTSGVYFIMITLAFAQMLFFFFVSIGAYGGEDGISLWSRNQLGELSLQSGVVFYYVCLAALSVFLLLASRMVDARFGRVLAGCRQNERRMRALGFPTNRYKLVAFAIAGASAGLAGALMTNQVEYTSPGLLHWTQSGTIMVMVILGGIGTLFGPVLGAIAFLALEEVLSHFTEHWQVVLGPVLLFIVLFARRGLWGLVVGSGVGR